MAYATAQQALEHGSIIYGSGNVKAVRSSNGFIYWPKQQTVAMDSIIDGVVAAKIERAKKLVRQRSEDDAAIRELFPTLLAVAEDGMEEEQRDLFGEPEAEDATEGNTALGTHYEASVKASREYWNNVSKRNRQRSQFEGSTGRYASPSAVTSKAAKAADSIKRNATKSRQYSAFSTSAQLCKVS